MRVYFACLHLVTHILSVVSINNEEWELCLGSCQSKRYNFIPLRQVLSALDMSGLDLIAPLLESVCAAFFFDDDDWCMTPSLAHFM